MHKRINLSAMVAVFVIIFLYLPITAVVGLSFNQSSNSLIWKGFSLDWYKTIWSNEPIMSSFQRTIFVAVVTTILSLVIGTTISIGLNKLKAGGFLRTFSTAPAIVPDLVLAIGLLTTFSVISMSLSLTTVIISHTVFCTAFVVAVVLARIGLIDPSIEEASTDLGASAIKTLFKITIPQLMPSLIAGAVLSFTLSMDEFVIAFFTNGPETPTLPMVIYSMIRFGVTPEINVLGTLLLVISFVGVILAQRIGKVADSI
ncbi:putrescine/spermidine ABC transporter permease [Actinomycetes bacterium]|nr:putrescine/spermidine ABC transporter permease [Actinomycetes bacterium]